MNSEADLGPVLTPADLLRKYAADGYDFVAVTEHQRDAKFDSYTWPKVFDEPGVKGVISMTGSAEDTAPESHILAIGFDPAINEATLGSSPHGGNGKGEVQSLLQHATIPEEEVSPLIESQQEMLQEHELLEHLHTGVRRDVLSILDLTLVRR